MTNLVVNFDTLQQLYRAYMPFIKPAGLFVSSNDTFFWGSRCQ